MTDKPMKGFRILDLGQGVAAPYCGLLLAQYGAEVIKVEPLKGDWMRGLGESREGHTAYSISYNWAKKGIAVDLKEPKGREFLLKIAKTSDVILENFRPGVVDRLGIGFDDVKAVNSKVLYVSISGFGQSGPYVERPGSDTVLQAFSGLVSINKDQDGRPHKVGTTMIDALTGLCAFQAVSMALFNGIKTARFLDISLLQSAAILLTPNIADFHLNGGPVPPLNAPAGSYRTSNGWIAVSLVKEENFAQLCKAIGRPEIANETRFVSFEKRAENLVELFEIMQGQLKTRTTEEWIKRCSNEGVLASSVNDFGDWLEDAQVKSINGYDMITQPGVGEVPMPRLPGGQMFEGEAPSTGQHTKSVMCDIGYSESEINEMLAAGIILDTG